MELYSTIGYNTAEVIFYKTIYFIARFEMI